MSTKTIYKRIALVAVAALGAGLLSVAPANAATSFAFSTNVTNGGEINRTDSGGVEYATYSMAAGALERITLLAVDEDGYAFTNVAITGATGTFTAASRSYQTGTFAIDYAPNPDNQYCAYTTLGTASGSAATAGTFAGPVLLSGSIAAPTGYGTNFGNSWVNGGLCGQWNGAGTNASVVIPATTAGQIVVRVTQYDTLASIDTEQVITINVLPAASIDYAMTKTYFTSGQHTDSGGLGNSGYGVKDGAGVIYSPAVSGDLVGRFGATQFLSDGTTEVAANRAKAMEWSITGPGCIRSWTVGNNDCPPGTNVNRLFIGAGDSSSLNVRLDSDGTPGTTTLTAKVDGVVVKTYTIKFFGKVTAISFVAAQTIGKAGGGNTGSLDFNDSIANDDADCGEYLCIYSMNSNNSVAYGVVMKDALGTSIPIDSNYTGKFGTLSVSTSNAAVISDPDDYCEIEDGAGAGTVAAFATHCEFTSATTAVSGQTANAVWTMFNYDGTVVTASQALTIGGAPKTVTVAFDKTSYAIGTPAKITLTAKDASGNPVFDGATPLSAAGLTSNLAVSGAAIAGSAKTVKGAVTVSTFAPVVTGAWTLTGSDANGVAVSAATTVTPASDVVALTTLVNSLIAKMNALNKLVVKIQKKVKAK